MRRDTPTACRLTRDKRALPGIYPAINNIGLARQLLFLVQVNREATSAMNENCAKGTIEEPKYFLLWIALWIIALLILLPQA